MKLFQELDTENKGHLTSENLSNFFGKQEDFMGFDFKKLIKSLSGGSEEDRLSYVQLQDALTPYGSRGQRGYQHSMGGAYSRKSPEQQVALEETLKNQINLVVFVLSSHAKCDPSRETETEACMSVDEAYAIWDDLDNYRHGYISPSGLQRWLSDFAEFNLPFEDLHYLNDCFGVPETDGRITEELFVRTLCGRAAQLEEGAAQDGGEPEAGKWVFCPVQKKWTANPTKTK